jgi:hypothetical protein
VRARCGAQVSVAARSLCWWILSVANSLKVHKETELRLGRIREGEERLGNTALYVRKLRGELSAGRVELSRQSHDQRVLEQQLGEAAAQLKDSDLAKANMLRLAELVQVRAEGGRDGGRSGGRAGVAGRAPVCEPCGTRPPAQAMLPRWRAALASVEARLPCLLVRRAGRSAGCSLGPALTGRHPPSPR